MYLSVCRSGFLFIRSRITQVNYLKKGCSCGNQTRSSWIRKQPWIRSSKNCGLDKVTSGSLDRQPAVGATLFRTPFRHVTFNHATANGHFLIWFFSPTLYEYLLSKTWPSTIGKCLGERDTNRHDERGPSLLKSLDSIQKSSYTSSSYNHRTTGQTRDCAALIYLSRLENALGIELKTGISWSIGRRTSMEKRIQGTVLHKRFHAQRRDRIYLRNGLL